MGRSWSIAAYCTLLATCIAGIFHAPWWAACAGACSLALLSLVTQRVGNVPQLKMVSDPVLVFATFLNAAAAAAGAYVFGHLARWFWGL